MVMMAATTTGVDGRIIVRIGRGLVAATSIRRRHGWPVPTAAATPFSRRRTTSVLFDVSIVYVRIVRTPFFPFKLLQHDMAGGTRSD